MSTKDTVRTPCKIARELQLSIIKVFFVSFHECILKDNFLFPFFLVCFHFLIRAQNGDLIN